MAITTRYQSDKPLNPKHGPVKRYVRRGAVGPGYAWCKKQTHSRYDIAQGECTGDDLPAHIREAADAQRGQAFGYVDWPEQV